MAGSPSDVKPTEAPPARVSVLLPVREAEGTLASAIGSVLAEPDQALEVVVVDDGSRDSTWTVLERLAASDPRIRPHRRPAGGIVAALNFGIERCEGDLIARMDADDRWVLGRLRRQRDRLAADPQLAAVGGRVQITSQRGLTPGLERYQSWLNSVITPADVWRERYVESPLVHPAAMIRRRWLRQLGGYRQGPFPEDYDLWLRILAAGGRLCNVPEAVLEWVDSPGRLTRTDARYRRRGHLDLKAEHLAAELNEGQQVVIVGAGPTGLRLGRQLVRRGVGLTAWIDIHPARIGQLIDGLPVRDYAQLKTGPAEGTHLLVAVGTPGAREEVRAFLGAHGFREGAHFTCCA